MWERIEDPREDVERKWENSESGDVVVVKRFETGTWDTFFNKRLLENYDTAEEAVKRGRKAFR